MITPPHYQAMVKAAAAVAVVAVVSVVRVWSLQRRRWANASQPGRRCARLALEHPQTAGVFLAAGCATTAAIAFVCWTSAALSPYTWGIYLFFLAAFAGIGAALAIGGLAAWAAAFFAMRRLLGEVAGFGALFLALTRQSAFFGAWLRWLLLVGEDGWRWHPFVLPAALSDGCDPATAARRAANFLAQAPQTLAVLAPLRQRALGAVVAVLGVGLPVLVGFLSLPVLPYMGYAMAEVGLGLYPIAMALLGLAWCAGWLLAAFQIACALIQASAVYVYGTGTGATRERVLAKLSAEWVWPTS